MNPTQEYELTRGTIMGEIRNEIFQKYGQVEYETAKYGWHHAEVSETEYKTYILVNCNLVQFLVGTATCQLVDRRVVDPETGKRIGEIPLIIRDDMNPTNLHLEWINANIPFVDKDVLDSQGISYTLP